MSGGPLGRDIVEFHEFEFDAETGELWKAGAAVKLQPQPAKILALLAGRPGQLVTRDEIRDRIWGKDTFVEFDQSLNFCIRQLRTALGDTADTPRYIETLPRRGYRFIAPVARRGPAGVGEPPTPLTTPGKWSARRGCRSPRSQPPSHARPLSSSGSRSGVAPSAPQAVCWWRSCPSRT
jgi:DNA-binding winged helix-turn-helix (wHTH) protein